MNFRVSLKLLGALVSGAVAYSLLRDLFDNHAVTGVYIPIPVKPVPPKPLALVPTATFDVTAPAITLDVTVPAGAAPHSGSTTVALGVRVFQLEVGRSGLLSGRGRSLILGQDLEDEAFAVPPKRNLDATPGVPETITFQLKPGIHHIAVVVTSVQKVSDGDSRFRGVGIVAIPQPDSLTTTT